MTAQQEHDQKPVWFQALQKGTQYRNKMANNFIPIFFSSKT